MWVGSEFNAGKVECDSAAADCESAREHIEAWSSARLRALLERTEKWFPRELEEHTLPCITQGVGAVKELGGWALILR